MRTRVSRLLIPLVTVVVGGALAAIPLAASAVTSTDRSPAGSLRRPAADSPQARGVNAPIGGVVPGLTGTAAQQAAGAAAERFRQVTEDRLRRSTDAPDGAPAGDVSTLASQLHTDWGVNMPASQSSGLHATQSVLTGTSPTHGGDYVYAPTAIPAGGACMEMTTAYTPSGPKLWAWDWCGGRDNVGKIVNIDSTFLSTYTTTVNGQPAYSVDIHQTAASTNTWTTYLYNYVSHAWDTFYTSSGTYDLPQFNFGWNMFEIYTSVDPATGAGYYCKDLAGRAFESTDAQVYAGGAWTPVTTANSRLTHSSIPSGNAYDCPALTFSVVHPNDHWLARIGGGTTTPPTTTQQPPTTTASRPPTTTASRPPTTTQQPPTTTASRPPTTTASGPPTTTQQPPTTTASRPPTTTATGGPVTGACVASYRLANSWPGGFQGEVTVTAGSSTVNGWTVTLTFPSGVSVTQVWNGVVSGSSPAYTVRNQSYNGGLGPNGSTTFGFLGSGTAGTPTLTCTSP